MKKLFLFVIGLFALAAGFSQNYVDGPVSLYGPQYNAATTISATGSITVGAGGNYGFGGNITALARNTASGTAQGITFTGGGTYSNAGSAPFIDGYATAVNSALTLPVGEGSNLRNVALAANSATVSTAWFNGAANTTADPSDGSTHAVNRSSVDASLNGISMQGFWDWVGSGSVSATFSMPDMSSEAASAGDVRIVGWNGSQWSDLGAPAPASLAAGTQVTATVPAGITAITFGTTQYLLPVSLISFQGQAGAGCSVQLSWKSGTEVNSSRYEVEVSADGMHYSKAGEVASRNAQGGSQYSYTYANAGGTVYFRLRMVDKDGNSSYSKVVPVTGTCGVARIQVTPNPTRDRIVVSGLSGRNTITIYSITGQLLQSKQSSNALETLNLASYAPATYVIKVTDDKGKVQVAKVVKE